MRHPNDKCYVCANAASGSVFGMAVCAPCKKFVWRHRFSNLSSLRCEVGFGPQRNNCDLTRKRSCTKCRLRRSIEGNRRLRQFLEKNAPDTINGGKLAVDPAANDGHVRAMDKLRGFLATKKPSATQLVDQPPLGMGLDSDDDSSMSGADRGRLGSSGSTGRNMTSKPLGSHHMMGNAILTPVPSDSDSVGLQNTYIPHRKLDDDASASASSPSDLTMTGAAGNLFSFPAIMQIERPVDSESKNARIYQYLMWAINFIQPTYSTFTSRFNEIFKNCSQEEFCQLLLLSAKNNGASFGGFGEALLAIVTNGVSLQEQELRKQPAQLPDVLSAFNLYFSLATQDSSTVTPAVLLDTIRNNSCFAQLTNIPMQFVISNNVQSNANLVQQFTTLLAR